MASLLKTNPYLRNPRKRRLMLEQDSRESSMMEGARGLPKAGQVKRRSQAYRKKRAKGS